VNENWTQLDAFPEEPEDTTPKEEIASIADVAPEAAPTEPLPRINNVRAKYVLQAEKELEDESNEEPFSHMDVATRATKKWLEDTTIMAHPPDKIKTEDAMLATYEQYLAAKEKYPAEVLDLILHGTPKVEPEVTPKKTRIKRTPKESWTAKLEREQYEREEEQKKLLGISDLVPDNE